MGSGDSLQDWSSDSISSHQTQVRSPAVQKLQLQLAQALIALSLLHYITLITSFCFFSYLVCNYLVCNNTYNFILARWLSIRNIAFDIHY